LKKMSSNVSEVGAAASIPTMIDRSKACEIIDRAGSKMKMMYDRVASYAVADKKEWLSMHTKEVVDYKLQYALREG
ncbi:hypothetical protein PFISCL1PPCAC_2811, partial [Pristionchus fissidentatus]